MMKAYKLINTLDSPTYMVPNGTGSRGAYRDFLNNKHIYNHYEANIMGNSNIPSGSPQMLGGMYAIWGDSLLDVRLLVLVNMIYLRDSKMHYHILLLKFEVSGLMD
ncbi:hypothetical protein ONA00_01790 [Mycoplasmopsis cynos]|uniref:hypothetical protein n=1 Tax=Mycoplasmopsis cynos TaxID=171284 RepID=UPI0024C8EF01|nr:hypothetical protein [Mycoplasmopsis cynos]WAM11210.1 hypothetical protein ONA00_01790 [Mycoplasmopsis cynos]